MRTGIVDYVGYTDASKHDWVGIGPDAASTVMKGSRAAQATHEMLVHCARMLLLGLLEAGNAFVHVPAEGTDHADVVVEVHLAIRDDVEAGFLLIANGQTCGVVECLSVIDRLERDADVAAEQLMCEPLRAWVRANHCRWQERVDDLSHPWSLPRELIAPMLYG